MNIFFKNYVNSMMCCNYEISVKDWNNYGFYEICSSVTWCLSLPFIFSPTRWNGGIWIHQRDRTRVKWFETLKPECKVEWRKLESAGHRLIFYRLTSWCHKESRFMGPGKGCKIYSLLDPFRYLKIINLECTYKIFLKIGRFKFNGIGQVKRFG